jgi:hypothetical protein
VCLGFSTLDLLIYSAASIDNNAHGSGVGSMKENFSEQNLKILTKIKI